MRTELFYARRPRRALLVATTLAVLLLAASTPAAAGGLLDFLFGGVRKEPSPPPQAIPYADPIASQRIAPAPRSASPSRSASAGGSEQAFCVRTCDGRYFPLTRGKMSPAQMCRAFCPASATKVYFGSSIDSAYASNGERYAESKNAFSYRKELRSDCTCNGRDPAGLAPLDLALDNSLREGDVIATTDGLVAYTGVRTGNEQVAEFTPIASYRGLTTEVRARLGEMKIAPVRAEPVAANALMPGVGRDAGPAKPEMPKTPSPRSDMRAAVD